MKLNVIYHLVGLEGEIYGKVFLKKFSDDWYLGVFHPTNKYNTIKHLFIKLEEYANNQVLSLIDEIFSQIELLNLQLCSLEGDSCFKITDVQIMNGNEIIFKINN